MNDIPSFSAGLAPSIKQSPYPHLAYIYDQLLRHTIMEYTAYTPTVNSGNVNCGNVTNSHNNIVNLNQVIADKNPEIMQWLSPLDPRRSHQDVRTYRFDSVGSWFLETSEFREWRSGEGGADKAVLFCYGNQGVGKTFLR